MAKPKSICNIDKCSNHVVGWGLCEKHYRRWKRHGSTDDPKPKPKKICLVENCCDLASGPGTSNGYCKKHYARFYRYGDPLGGGSFVGERERWIEDNADHKGRECLRFPFGTKRGTVTIDGRSMNAARAMCLAAFGEPSDPSYYACHKCRGAEDGCVNPEHLYWGTPEQNQLDRLKDGTDMRGEKSHAAKLTQNNVVEIRRRADSEPRTDLAVEFGIHVQTVHRIARRERWAWLE